MGGTAYITSALTIQWRAEIRSGASCEVIGIGGLIGVVKNLKSEVLVFVAGSSVIYPTQRFRFELEMNSFVVILDQC
jgi:hypothetical protein